MADVNIDEVMVEFHAAMDAHVQSKYDELASVGIQPPYEPTNICRQCLSLTDKQLASIGHTREEVVMAMWERGELTPDEAVAELAKSMNPFDL